MTDDEIGDAERKLGHVFGDRGLFRRALTHASADVANNEPLASLGDRIYAVWVARRAYVALPRPTSAAMSRIIDLMGTGRGVQAAAFYELGLDRHLVLGGARLGQGGGVTGDMAATAFEAVVAAIELDGGPDAAVAFLERAVSADLYAALP